MPEPPEPAAVFAPPAADEPLALAAAIEQALDAGEAPAVVAWARRVDAADLAAAMNLMRPDRLSAFVAASGGGLDPRAVVEMAPKPRAALLATLDSAFVARAALTLDSDDALSIIEDLDDARQAEILDLLPGVERERLADALERPEGSAGRLMQTAFVVAPPFWRVGQLLDFLRESRNLPDAFHAIYVVDPAFRPIGALALDKVLRARRDARVVDLMNRRIHVADMNMPGAEAAEMFRRYDLLAAPVVRPDGRLAGVLTADDMTDVSVAKAEDAILNLGRVGENATSVSSWRGFRVRFSWLAVNLLTAILASAVIWLFDAAIQKVVALATLMPIVTSMGGIAATQTLTLAVRALRAREMGASQRFFARELALGALNGVAFALIVGALGGVLFANAGLGVALGLAMAGNLILAATIGAWTPLLFARWGADPAVASPVVATTATDVAGFALFLGLGAVLAT